MYCTESDSNSFPVIGITVTRAEDYILHSLVLVEDVLAPSSLAAAAPLTRPRSNVPGDVVEVDVEPALSPPLLDCLG